jgi:hypothetical protein
MVWFACKQCGKRHGRADNLSGTLVFCECGHGNRVPWTSTVPEPEPEEVPTEPPPRQQQPAGGEERAEPDVLRPQRRLREVRRPNPAYCLNHDDVASEKKCDACHCSFCAACVVTLQGQTLCGPCKNFRVRGRNRPGHVAPLAVIAFVLALVCAPVTSFLNLLSIGIQVASDGSMAAAIVLCVVALALPIGDLIVGWMALRQIENQPNLDGRGLALTGAITGLAGLLWCLSTAVLSVVKSLQG